MKALKKLFGMFGMFFCMALAFIGTASASGIGNTTTVIVDMMPDIIELVMMIVIFSLIFGLIGGVLGGKMFGGAGR